MSARVHSLRPALLALALLASALFAPAPALAHAVLLTTAPAAQALLAEAPQTAELTFNEVVSPLSIRLIGPDGAERDLTGAVPGGAKLVISLGELARGTQALSWRVASDDGHPVAGTLVFSVGQVTGAVAVVEHDPLVASLLWAAKLVMAAGLILGVGGALFAALAGLPPGLERGVRALIGTGLVATPLALGLHGADALGVPLGRLATAAPWAAGWSTGFGTMTALALAAGLAALAGLRLRWPAFLAVALLAAAYASAGHAGAAHPRWLTRPAVFLHLAMLCFWLGALLPLAGWLRRPDGGPALRRFSALIPAAVLLLAASGGTLALVQMGTATGAWSTAYGRILAAKLALLAVLLLLAAWNRWALTGPALQGEAAATGRLRRSILVELGLVLAILGLVAGWRFTTPPRALAQVAAAPAAAPATGHIHAAAGMAELTVTPGAAGPVSVAIRLWDSDMQPLAPLAVTLGLALPERGIERITRDATADAEGLWHVEGLILPQPGEWQVDLELRLSRFTLARMEGSITIE